MALTRAHILRAIDNIRTNGYPKERESTKWDLLDDQTGLRFPPKVILHLAHAYAGIESRPGGGWPTNGVLEAHDFTVVPKDPSAVDDAEKDLEKLDDAALKAAAENGQKKSPPTVQMNVKVVARSPAVGAYVKRLAAGQCDLCREQAPFETRRGAYLECHHIEPLSRGGPDTIDNTVALCPNCHRKMHLLNSPRDRTLLLERVQKRA